MASELGESEYIRPEHFVEVEGRGIFGKANEREIKLGPAEFVNHAESSGQVASEVYVVAFATFVTRGLARFIRE